MNETELLANTLFSETKDYDDAEGIASVVMNRLKRPQRFGGDLQSVVLAPYQFSGVGSNEWKKAEQKKFTKEEEKIYKNFLRISHSALIGKLEDKTGGADHYVNLKKANPSWAKVYKKTAKLGEHTYFKEVLAKEGIRKAKR